MTNQLIAVETQGVSKRYTLRAGWRSLFTKGNEKVALDRIDLSIPTGEIFGLLGPNGAGKTTLIKILATLVVPSAGRAWVAGFNVTEKSLEVRRRIGVVYGDERTFFWRLSAQENLRFYASLYQVPPKLIEGRIRYLLDLVGLTKATDTRLHHFSSGMKQRLSIARGLLTNPDILFLDEPTHNLDPLASQELRALVRERVLDRRRTVLLTTNIMAEAEELCHQVAFINQGQVQIAGAINELQQRLQTEDVHVLVVSAVPEWIFSSIQQIPGVHSLTVSQSEGSQFRVELRVQRKSNAVPLTIRRIVEAGGNVWSSAREDLSLEQIFAMAIRADHQSHQLGEYHNGTRPCLSAARRADLV